MIKSEYVESINEELSTLRSYRPGEYNKCKGCNNRSVGCHGNCEHYHKFSRATELVNELKRVTLDFKPLLSEFSTNKRVKAYH